MIDIITNKGDKWSFDYDTKRLYENGHLISGNIAEPIYSILDNTVPPEFSGIYVKSINSIITLSGNINKITNIEE